MIPWDEFWMGLLQVGIIIGLLALLTLVVLGAVAYAWARSE